LKPDGVAVSVCPTWTVPLIAAEPPLGATPWTWLEAALVALAEPQPEVQVFDAVITTFK
jgi:hypothetical protein